MKLITPILGGFALLMAVLAIALNFVNAGQDNRGTTVGFFVGTAIIFAVLAFISTFFNKQPQAGNIQTRINTNVRKLALIIIVPIVLFIAILYLLAWWLGKGLTF